MFDLSWSHIAILVVVALLVLGPKELPNAIRTGAQLLRTGRKLANEFRSGMDELVREAELEETRRTISQAMSEGVEKTLAENVDPTGELKSAIATDPLKELETSSPGATPAIAPPSDAPAAEASPAGTIPTEAEGATIIEHEPPPAPPHSIQPPPAESATDAASAAVPGAEDGPDQKRSAGG
jgi:sec-independent protein translocase protein TatB